MTPPGPRFRFAPTPSHALHLGNAAAAMIGWATARASRGAFIVRVEDIDSGRARPEFIEGGLDALEWLGLDWDEGPRVGGPFTPYLQSQRLALYDERLQQLGDSGQTFACVCSRADIRAAQRAPHLHAGEELPYPGTCRPTSGSPEARELAADRGGVRLHVQRLGEDAVVHWEDRWRGGQREDVRATSGDMLLGRAQRPTYQLAVVTDDIAMEITDVVRGEDLLGSTARQILLYRALGVTPPRFAHHPLLVDASGRKLSKRDSDISIDSYRANGRAPGAVLAWVARGLGLVSRQVRTMAPADWIDVLASEELTWSSGQLPEVLS